MRFVLRPVNEEIAGACARPARGVLLQFFQRIFRSAVRVTRHVSC